MGPKDIVLAHEFIGKYVTLRRVSRGWIGLCPFHPEKTPSFRVNDNFFKCFGCGEGGDIYSFLMQGGTGRKMSFKEADRYLRQEYNLPPDEMEGRVEAFWDGFTAFTAANADKARAFWANRGLDMPGGWGYCPPGYKPPDVDAANQAGMGARGTLMNGRFTVPLHDANGHLVGVAGRAETWVKGDRHPKWINSYFKKKDHLYNLHVAKDHIRETGVAVLVEGYSDVQVNASKLKGIVASMGTSFDKGHAVLLSMYGAKKVVLLRDGDAAGVKAMVKDGTVLMDAGIDVSCVRLPDGEDPDSFTTSGKDIRRYISLNMETYNEFIQSISMDPVELVVQQALSLKNPLATIKMVREASIANGIPQQVLLDAIQYEKSKN